MAFWNIDLTTEDGAQGAAMNGSTACFIVAGLTVLATALLGYASRNDPPQLIGILAYTGISIVLCLVAGWRLRAGKGAFWGCAVAALLAFEIIAKLVTLTGLLGLAVNIILLVVVVNGIRGALALRRGFGDDLAEVFE